MKSRIGKIISLALFILLIIIIMSSIKKCEGKKQEKEITKEEKLRTELQNKINQNNKLISDKDQIIRKYIDCARQNDSLTQIAALKIDNESIQREKDITTRVIPDMELQRQMSDFYRKFNR